LRDFCEVAVVGQADDRPEKQLMGEDPGDDGKERRAQPWEDGAFGGDLDPRGRRHRDGSRAILPKAGSRKGSKHNERNQIFLWESLASALRSGLLASLTPPFRAKSRDSSGLSRRTGISAIRLRAAIFRDVLTIFTGISAEISEVSAEISGRGRRRFPAKGKEGPFEQQRRQKTRVGIAQAE